MKKYAPICLFTYNRLKETIRTIEALQNNRLAEESELFIFSDGSKDEFSKAKVLEVRKYINKVKGFKKVTIFESKVNKGLAKSIIDGVSQIILEYRKVIVLEDDLISAPNFLEFMNEALNFYSDNNKVFSISGFTLDLPSLKRYNKDFYYGYRASSWGWGTWKNRWFDIDWDLKDYDSFINSKNLRKKFQRGGSDLPRMLSNQMEGKIDSWAVRWCYNQFKKNQLTVFPSKSKIMSIGFGPEATHTKTTSRFETFLDESMQRKFNFSDEIEMDNNLVREFRAKFSIYRRLIDRLRF